MSEFGNRQERLESLLKNLVSDLEQDNLSKFTENLCDIYSDSSFRHLYSKISDVLGSFRPDERDALSQYIREICNHAKTYVGGEYSDEQQGDILAKINKLSDHIALECLRLSRIDRVEYIGKTATAELSAAEGKLKETEGKAVELGEQISHYQSQSISILGIFAGLVVTFSSIIQLSTNGLSNLSNIDSWKITYFVSLTMLFLFNIVFLLMYSISKISKNSIASNCAHRYCEDCKTCKCELGKLKKKYPYVLWFNVFGGLFCIFLSYMCSR